jgi:protein-S-isoprenylcysteine O-methyltransferase Ste14
MRPQASSIISFDWFFGYDCGMRGPPAGLLDLSLRRSLRNRNPRFDMRILPPVLLLIFIVAMLIAHFLIRQPTFAPRPYNFLGIVLMIVGVGIGLPAMLHFGRIKTNINTFNEPTVLVTGGVFRWTRNPMYLGMIVLLLGLAVLLGTLLPLLLAVIFAIIADRWYVRFEENAMRAKFGAAYEAYGSRTRRWL